MKYNYEFEVRFQDAGQGDRIRLSRLVDMIIDAIVKCAHDNGDGLDILRTHGAIWVLAKLSIEILQVPKRDDVLTFETWCERSGRGISQRNIRIWLPDSSHPDGSRLVAKVTSLWASIDIESRMRVDVYDLGVPHQVDGERLRLPKIANVSYFDDPVSETHYAVRYSDLDSNGHCNSGRYFELILDAIEPTEGFSPLRLEIDYLKEALLGQVLVVRWSANQWGYRLNVVDLSGESCCRATIETAKPPPRSDSPHPISLTTSTAPTESAK